MQSVNPKHSLASSQNIDEEKHPLLPVQDLPVKVVKRQRSRRFSFRSDPVTLTWENLNVFVPPKKKLFKKSSSQPPTTKHILKDVSGIISSGQLVALMGASGSGKTTLFNVLTSRNIRNLVVDGDIKVNGQEIGRNITAISAYVQQDDMFVGTMTVREHLLFQAFLRLPKNMSRNEKIRRVDEVLFELGLTKCRNTKIGIAGVFKGISGGEAKRLAFASEVLTDPPLLFCDEPTTGLDAFMAQSVITVLENLANNGKTVICTIHQPASEVYAMFNRVLFLAEGRVAYFGSSEGALKFFDSLGHVCPDDYNPADFFVHTLAVVPGKEEECRERIANVCDNYHDSDYYTEVDKMIAGSRLTSSRLNLDSIVSTKKSPYKANWFVQFSVLLWRSMLNNFRNKNVIFVKVAQKIVLALFVGLIYLDTAMNQEGIMNINGSLFFMLAEYSFGALFGVLTILPMEFPVLVREHHNGMYKISSYYVSKMVSYIPTYTVDGIFFITIAYFMIGLRRTAEAFFLTLLVGVLIEQVSSGFGTMLSAISPNFAIALTIVGPIMTLIQMTGGLYTNVATIPIYLSWFQYISWFRYGFEAFAIVQWHDVSNITCDTPLLACTSNGDAVLSNLSFNPANFGKDMGLMLVLYIGFNFLGYLGLWFRIYRGR